MKRTENSIRQTIKLFKIPVIVLNLIFFINLSTPQSRNYLHTSTSSLVQIFTWSRVPHYLVQVPRKCIQWLQSCGWGWRKRRPLRCRTGGRHTQGMSYPSVGLFLYVACLRGGHNMLLLWVPALIRSHGFAAVFLLRSASFHLLRGWRKGHGRSWSRSRL